MDYRRLPWHDAPGRAVRGPPGRRHHPFGRAADGAGADGPAPRRDGSGAYRPVFPQTLV